MKFEENRGYPNIFDPILKYMLVLKVIVGAHAVMADGGVIAPVGLNLVALGAQRHAVPFVVLVGIHKVFLYSYSYGCLLPFSERISKRTC